MDVAVSETRHLQEMLATYHLPPWTKPILHSSFLFLGADETVEMSIVQAKRMQYSINFDGALYNNNNNLYENGDVDSSMTGGGGGDKAATATSSLKDIQTLIPDNLEVYHIRFQMLRVHLNALQWLLSNHHNILRLHLARHAKQRFVCVDVVFAGGSHATAPDCSTRFASSTPQVDVGFLGRVNWARPTRQSIERISPRLAQSAKLVYPMTEGAFRTEEDAARVAALFTCLLAHRRDYIPQDSAALKIVDTRGKHDNSCDYYLVSTAAFTEIEAPFLSELAGKCCNGWLEDVVIEPSQTSDCHINIVFQVRPSEVPVRRATIRCGVARKRPHPYEETDDDAATPQQRDHLRPGEEGSKQTNKSNDNEASAKISDFPLKRWKSADYGSIP